MFARARFFQVAEPIVQLLNQGGGGVVRPVEMHISAATRVKNATGRVLFVFAATAGAVCVSSAGAQVQVQLGA